MEKPPSYGTCPLQSPAAFLLMLLVIPGLTAGFYSGKELSVHETITGAMLLTGLAALMLKRGKRNFPYLWQERNLYGEFVIGASLLMLFQFLWFQTYIRTAIAHSYATGMFRTAFRNIHAPLYGYPEIPEIRWAVAMAGCACLFFLFCRQVTRRTQALSSPSILVGCLLFQAAFMIVFALSENPSRLLDYIGSLATFREDAVLFQGPLDILKHFSRSLGEIGSRTAHYPPGFLMFYSIGEKLGISWLFKFSCYAAALATTIVLWTSSAFFSFSARARFLTAGLFLTAAQVLIYPSHDPCCWNMLLCLLATVLFLKALAEDRVVFGILSGLAFSLSIHLSYVTFVAGLIPALAFLIAFFTRTIGTRILVRQTLITLLTICLVGLGIWLLFDLNIITLVLFSIAKNHQTIAFHPFESITYYLLRSTGNLLAFFFVIGAPVLTLCAIGTRYLPGRTGSSLFSIFWLSTLGSLLVAGFSELFILETERIWIFFTPALTLMAGHTLDRILPADETASVAGVLACSLIPSMVLELFFRSHLAAY
ncbi:MAG: hypothetical protein ACOZF0_22225 [Thermodesulfobacteriota bacterium]